MNMRKIRFHPMRRCAVRDARGQGACSARLVRTSKKEKHVSSGFAAPIRGEDMPEKREIVEQTAQDFEKLPNDMKMYVLGYMARCMEERATEKKPA